MAAEPRTAVFEFEQVTVTRGGRRILDGLTARIPAAGITVVAGPSGAGKSTLLRCATGSTSRTRCHPLPGAAAGRPRPAGAAPPGRHGVPAARPVSGSVAANLAEAMPGITDGVMAAALERVALDPGLLGQEARTLSGGELQRVCLARTLVTGPETLLLDEPTSALDAQPKLIFEQTAKELAATGITIIWVTHDDAQAGRVADRVYELRDGRLAEPVPGPHGPG